MLNFQDVFSIFQPAYSGLQKRFARSPSRMNGFCNLCEQFVVWDKFLLFYYTIPFLALITNYKLLITQIFVAAKIYAEGAGFEPARDCSH